MSDLEVVLKPRAAVAEGPVWDDRTNRLVWVDIMNNAVHVFDPASGEDRAIDVGQPVGAAVLRENGGLALALRDGFALMDANFGALEWIAKVEESLPTNRMNDGKCDAAGRFWAGTMPFGGVPGSGALYRLDPDYNVTQVLPEVRLSNGLDWTADNRLMYYVDTPTCKVDVFDFDLENGAVRNRRTVVNVPRDAGMPDGMTLDSEGGLWVALHGGGVVNRYTPDGKLDQSIQLPVKHVTCPAFGGPDYGDLYITSMTYGLSPDSMGDRELAGSLFRIRPGVRGRAPHRFAG